MRKINSSRNLATGSVLVLLSACQSATAEYRGGGSFYDYARVTGADPIYETVVKSVPVEQCWKERVPVRHSDYGHRARGHRHHNQSATPTIVGAIIGGALGNELGSKKRNKQIGVAVGSILGASIGRDIGRDRQREEFASRHSGGREYEVVDYELVERCSVEHEEYKEQALVGYDVTYRYKGNSYQTVTQTHPGDTLKVRLNIAPAEY